MKQIICKALVAAATVSAMSTGAPAAEARPIDDIKQRLGAFDEIKKEVDTLRSQARGASSSARQAMRDLEHVEQAGRFFVNAVRKGEPFPLYFSKPGSGAIKCGDKVWLHNTANDRVLASQERKGKDRFKLARMNTGFVPQNRVSRPNIEVVCPSKSRGKALTHSDQFTLKLDLERNLDDGKPYLKGCDGCKRLPRFRLDTLDAIKKEKAYFRLRGVNGELQEERPFHLIATNRGSRHKANVGGYCQVGAAPVVKLEFGNHCNHKWLAAAVLDQGVGKPPQWMNGYISDVRARIKKLRDELKRGGSSAGSKGNPGRTRVKSSRRGRKRTRRPGTRVRRH